MSSRLSWAARTGWSASPAPCLSSCLRRQLLTCLTHCWAQFQGWCQMCAWRLRKCCSHGWVRLQSWNQQPVHGTPVCTPWGQGPCWTVRELRKEEAPETISTIRTAWQSPAFWWDVSARAVTQRRGERTASPSVSLSSSFIKSGIFLPHLLGKAEPSCLPV